MMRKSYGSLPKLHALPRQAKEDVRRRVRCRLEMESSRVRVMPGEASPGDFGRNLGEAAVRICDRGLRGAPRFAAALQEYSARHLVETIVEGLLQLTSNEIEGFSICPLVTESLRFTPRDPLPAGIDVTFRAAILTFYAEEESAVAKAHEGHLLLYTTYYKDVVLRYAARRMSELLEPVRAVRLEDLEAHATESLGQALSELRRLFPLEPFQEKYESAPATPDQKAGIVRAICRGMRQEARRRLGI
jgi:hypothetical protein